MTDPRTDFESDYCKLFPVSVSVNSDKFSRDEIEPDKYRCVMVQVAYELWLAGQARAEQAYGLRPGRPHPAPLAHMDDQATPEENWDFWKGIVCDDSGKVDIERLKLELSDFSMLIRFYSAILCDVTGNMISKPNTHPSAVLSVFNDYLTLRCNETAGEALDDAVNAVQALSGSKSVSVEAANEVVEELQAIKKDFA